MALLGMFKREKPAQRINGIIKYLSLEAFWLSCSSQEQESLTRYYRGGLGTGPKTSPIEGNISSSSETVFKYLSAMIGWATSEKNYSLADKLIGAGQDYPVSSKNILDAHFFFQEAAECYYKQRDIRADALDLTIEFCRRDLSILPQYIPTMKKEYGSIPRIVTIQRLIIVYEKIGEIQEAIDLCKLAIEYNLTDNTKSGYIGRLEKLAKKNK